MPFDGIGRRKCGAVTLRAKAERSSTARSRSTAPRGARRAFELAVEHVNEGGGVFGLPVAVAVGDATANPEKAVANDNTPVAEAGDRQER